MVDSSILQYIGSEYRGNPEDNLGYFISQYYDIKRNLLIKKKKLLMSLQQSEKSSQELHDSTYSFAINRIQERLNRR